MLVYSAVDDALSHDFPLGDALEVFVRREDAERFIEYVRGDDPDVAACLSSGFALAPREALARAHKLGVKRASSSCPAVL
jgi:hypothetical protein